MRRGESNRRSVLCKLYPEEINEDNEKDTEKHPERGEESLEGGGVAQRGSVTRKEERKWQPGSRIL